MNYSVLKSGFLGCLMTIPLLSAENSKKDQSSLYQGCLRGQEYLQNEAEESPLRVFASFSMPEETWIQLSKDLEKIGGIFVLKGLPNGSFQEFLQKVMELRKKGVAVSIEIDPDSFEKYEVTAVPTFVLVNGESFEKVVGNVSVSYALEKLEIRN